MSWTIIVILSLIGIVMGTLTVNGFTRNIEIYLWLFFAFAASIVIAMNATAYPFLHSLLTGLSWGILSGMIQSLFFPVYLSNNPHLKEDFEKITFIKPRFFVLLTVPVMGFVTGGAIGLIALVLRMILSGAL